MNDSAEQHRGDEERRQARQRRVAIDAPHAMPIEPASIGPRTPTRSASRPAGIAKNIGSSANSAIRPPTVAAFAPSDSASSDTATRAPVSTR